jgi:hypothetical protein
MKYLSIASLLLLLGATNAGITKDRDLRHKHSDKYFEQLHKRTEDGTHYYVHLIPHSHDDVGWLKNPD